MLEELIMSLIILGLGSFVGYTIFDIDYKIHEMENKMKEWR